MLSNDQDNDPGICAVVGTAFALSISDVPWNGPIAGVWLGLKEDGTFLINPTVEEREGSLMHVTVAGTKEKIVMIEAGSSEVTEEVKLEGLKYAHGVIKEMCEFIESVAKEIGKEKMSYEAHDVNHEIYDKIKEAEYANIQHALDTDD